MNTSKPKVIKDFDKLSEEMQEKMNEMYPNGYADHIIRFTDKDGKNALAVPFETEDRYYLIRLSSLSYIKPPKDDDPIGDDLDKDDVNDDASDKYTDLDTMRVGGSRRNDDDDDYD